MVTSGTIALSCHMHRLHPADTFAAATASVLGQRNQRSSSGMTMLLMLLCIGMHMHRSHRHASFGDTRRTLHLCTSSMHGLPLDCVCHCLNHTGSRSCWLRRGSRL